MQDSVVHKLRVLSLRTRLRYRLAWLAEPWSRPSLYVPMVLAFAVPALFLATAHRFERAAADSVAEQVVQEVPPSNLGIGVQVGGLLEPDLVAAADAAISDRLVMVPALNDAILTIFTTSGSSASMTESLGRTPIPAAARLVARPGAIESLAIIDSTDAFAGVFVSQDYADRGNLVVGSEIEVVIETISVNLQVQGIYHNLWPEAPSYWRDLPVTLVPRRDPSAGRPTFEALIVTEELLLNAGLPGTLRWDATASPAPSTLAALEAAVSEFEAVETDLTLDPAIDAALQTFAGLAGAQPAVDTGLADALDETTSALRSIENPLAAAQTAGLALGMVAVAANASFLAFQRRRVWRVLVAEGDGPVRIFGLALAESVIPAVLGAVLGIFGSLTLTSLLVPNGGTDLAAIKFGPLAIFTLTGLGLAAMVTALIATETADWRPARVQRLAGQILVPVLVVAVVGWIQVGAETFSRSISPLVVVTPIAVLCAAAGLAMLGLRTALHATRHRTLAGRVPVLLGLRRSAASSATGVALCGALAISLGLCIFAVTMDRTRATSVEAKAVTIVGGQSSSSLVEVPPDQSPPGTSVVALSTLIVSPGSDTVRVVAIDAETYADVVGWSDEFDDRGPAEIVRLLEPSSVGDIPALVLSSRPIASEGTFGTGVTFDYRVVGSVDSAPLAPGTRPMLLLRADALEASASWQFETAFEREFGRLPTAEDVAELYSPPLDAYQLKLISNLRASELERVAMARELPAWDFVDLTDIVESPEEQVVRWSFRYLQFIGFVSLLISLLSVWLYATARKYERRATDRVALAMGITRSTAMRAAAVEYTLLALVALVPAVAAAIAVAARIGRVFERGPFPPRLELQVPVLPTLLLATTTLAVVVLIGVAAEQYPRGGQSNVPN